MRVLVAGGGTGGHLMPTLALADALRAVRPDVEPVVIGATRGVEASLLPKRDLPYRYHLLPAEPIYRREWWRNAVWLGVLPRLLASCRRIVNEEAPAFAVGTGGYAAGPILAMAHAKGIPFALQEQNASPGLTTRVLSRRASQLHLGFPEAEAHLRVGRHAEVFSLGNPVVPPGAPSEDAEQLELTGRPVCFVMGGSQGARAINHMIAAAIDRGHLADVDLLWSTGAGGWETFGWYHDPPRRHVRPFWDPIAVAYRVANLAVCRAGAMTVAELHAWSLPAILIPLPTAAADHQTGNARALDAAGCAVHLPQTEIDGDILARMIHSLLGDSTRLAAMAEATTARAKPDAARRIAERLLQLAE